MKKLLLTLPVLALIVAAGVAGGNVLERNRQIRELEELRAQLRAARFSVDSCQVVLAQEERQFRRFDRAVDSLRGVVRAYEDAELGGVLRDEYQEYMTVFEAYNDSVADWQARADALEAGSEACRTLTIRHNTLSDSLGRRVRALAEGG